MEVTHEQRNRVQQALWDLVSQDHDRLEAACAALESSFGIDTSAAESATDEGQLLAEVLRDAVLYDSFDTTSFVAALCGFVIWSKAEYQRFFRLNEGRLDRVLDRIAARLEADPSPENQRILKAREHRVWAADVDEDRYVKQTEQLAFGMVFSSQAINALGPLLLENEAALHRLFASSDVGRSMVASVLKSFGSARYQFAPYLIGALDAGKMRSSALIGSLAEMAQSNREIAAEVASRLTHESPDIARDAACILSWCKEVALDAKQQAILQDKLKALAQHQSG